MAKDILGNSSVNNIENIDFSDELKELEDLKWLVMKASTYLKTLEENVDNNIQKEFEFQTNPLDTFLAALNDKADTFTLVMDQIAKQSLESQVRLKKHLETLDKDKNPWVWKALETLMYAQAEKNKATAAVQVESYVSWPVKEFYTWTLFEKIYKTILSKAS